MTSRTVTVVLGGGRGTRLFPLTAVRSKPAVPIAGKYRLIGVPISIPGNSIAVGRVYKADMKAQKMVAASDWIKL